MPNPAYLKIDRAAEILGWTPDEVLDAIQTEPFLPVGAIIHQRPLWHGLALPNAPGPTPSGSSIQWKLTYASKGETPLDTLWRVQSTHGHDYQAKGCGIGGFWYIDPDEAVDVTAQGKAVVTTLHPEHGPGMHQANPDAFPHPDFHVIVFGPDGEGYGRILTTGDMRFNPFDIDARDDDSEEHQDNAPLRMVEWRRSIVQSWPAIEREHGRDATALQVIAHLKKFDQTGCILPHQDARELKWTPGKGRFRTVTEKTVINALGKLEKDGLIVRKP